MSDYAYAAGVHQYTKADLPERPEGSVETAMGVSNLPYVQGAEMECTSCHNVHLATARPFNQRTSLQSLCGACHTGRSNNTPLRGMANILGAGVRSFSSHPTQVSAQDQGGVNIKATIDARFRVALNAAPNYSLGGHLSAGATGVMDCTTCHAVHGIHGSPNPNVPDLLAIDNTTVAGNAQPSALCEGCHYGGDAGEQVGTLTAGGAVVYSDHPIDTRNNRTFYPTGAALPANWVAGATPNNDRGAQPFYTPANGQKTPVCSSCHDVHGGIASTALLRGPQAVGNWGISYDVWCFACHTNAQVIPNAHHSAVNNWVSSILSCGDCHGTTSSTDWKVHNGFWAFAVALSSTNSAFCQSCHTPTNPLDLVAPALKGQTFPEPASFPSSHGLVRGTASHYLGPDSNEFTGVAPRTSAWPSSNYFSSYGAPNTGGGGAVAPATAGEIICASCHHLTYNDGRARTGSYTSALTAGWECNLLLQPYQDDPSGTGNGTGAYAVGSQLCTGCHDPTQGKHHPLTGDPISTAYPARNLITSIGAGSFADQTAAPIGGGNAPGTLSYPNANTMDCDSCHRPHSADSDSTVNGAAHGFKTSSDGRPTYHILEVDGANHSFTPTLCPECHAR
jgi:predicted CXXCH cytochrome family protein